MARVTKADREESTEALRKALRECGPDGGSTLLIIDDGGTPSSSGRTHRLDVRVMSSENIGRRFNKSDDAQRPRNHRPRLEQWLTWHTARALGYRYSERHELILMGGYGYSRPLEIVSALARLCGHPLYAQSIGAGMGDVSGWFGEEPKKASGT